MEGAVGGGSRAVLLNGRFRRGGRVGESGRDGDIGGSLADIGPGEVPERRPAWGPASDETLRGQKHRRVF